MANVLNDGIRIHSPEPTAMIASPLPRECIGRLIVALMRSAWPTLLVACLVASPGSEGVPVHAQALGATLTVLRGAAGVLRADGTQISPATSGLTLGAGDRVATVGPSSALVTFFDGAELELGADTTIIIRDLARDGGRTTITVQSVVGTTLSRVVTLTGQGSTYRIEAGGTVALVRGTVFAHHVDPSGDITVAVGEGDVEYPGQGVPLRRGEKRTVTSRGDVADSRFDPATSLFTVVTEPVSSGNPSGTDNPGIGTGSLTAPQQQSQQQLNERDQQPQPTTRPGHTFLIIAALSGTTRLEVASTEGFAIGDLIRIGSGPGAEIGTIVGFGSILLAQPLAGSFAAGTPVDLVAHATPTATSTRTPTLGIVGTTVPSPTFTPTFTATATATPTITRTAITAATSTPTLTYTPTATATSTSTATLTHTPTQTHTPTATPPFPCLGPLVRDLAAMGGGTTGTTRAAAAGGIRLSVYVQLTDAAPNTSFDVYVDVAGGAAGVHQFVGTFITDGLGMGIFTGSIIVPTVAATIDNEVILRGEVPTRHQYIRQQFSPCPE